MRRSRLSPPLVERLQVLKHRFRQQLSLTDDWLAEEKDHTITGEISERALRDLMKAGKIEELKELLANEDVNSNVTL